MTMKIPPQPLAGVSGGFGPLLIAAALWATVGVADAAMTTELSTEAAGLARTALGALVLWLAIWARHVRAGRASARRTGRLPKLWVGVFGLCCAVFQITLFTAFRHVGIGVTVAVTVCLPPILMALAETVVTGRRIGWPLCLAILMGSVAVVILQPGLLSAGGSGSPVDAVGAGLLLTASLAFCGTTLASRRMSRQADSLSAAAAGLAAAAVVLLALVPLESPTLLPQLTTLPRGDVLLLLYTGVLATGGAYLAFAIGLRRAASPAAALAATMTEPVFALVFAATIAGEVFTSLQLFGAALMLAAILALDGRGLVMQAALRRQYRDG
jgi:drug/metabolite transporter, DME family